MIFCFALLTISQPKCVPGTLALVMVEYCTLLGSFFRAQHVGHVLYMSSMIIGATNQKSIFQTAALVDVWKDVYVQDASVLELFLNNLMEAQFFLLFRLEY